MQVIINSLKQHKKSHTQKKNSGSLRSITDCIEVSHDFSSKLLKSQEIRDEKFSVKSDLLGWMKTFNFYVL